MKALLTSMAVAAALVTGSAFAADNLSSRVSNNLYTYVSVGSGKLTNSSGSNTATSDNLLVYGLGLGYQFNPYFAVESGFMNFGKQSNDVGTKLKSNWNFDLAAKGILPVADQFDLYGKLGGAYVTSTWVSRNKNMNDFALEGALGASYTINSQLRTNLEALFVGKGQANNVLGRRAITLGMAYSF